MVIFVTFYFKVFEKLPTSILLANPSDDSH